MRAEFDQAMTRMREIGDELEELYMRILILESEREQLIESARAGLKAQRLREAITNAKREHRHGHVHH